ncbi:Asp-tRNA(Asn)/Glu-tRNA(Gln) amidotransferase GatCAB subunit B [Candidatus Shapirobacteria bacterium CG10_big_fil_rev_8_21_14_0_10_38_14]|uniref:Aspartyl/glutamyl-tRNA(Asn/Gln) amidotransferase subunit B n=1 Tax=Candidatus Shapirobacteria bacterium CG10_big_fil_rev_8_21_14_0_10_38_14 TaxID=1974483 RepID=A0A2M8L5J4_9BACT|nr:MAG: Asp-tRNA(Asn)/Glu-tRNA(Gln) amidotransferase GatCAB subunit B [Candidatus Shapirobacteria bacterium CG10_big_fil_rev_8_21_14_0_10_38_14]
MSLQPIIGLEIHVELKTKAKMFCGCSAEYFNHQPNTHCCPICLGLPGALPVANQKAIRWTVMAGLALNCQIPLFSKFDRKNYFYPDLAKGYQISQYDQPLSQNGQLGKVRIRRVHLEEDTAKMVHHSQNTLIDFNRSGVPLMEVVTEPDIHSSQEAKNFLKKLQLIIRHLGASDCDMEKGSMRLEANISLKSGQGTELPNYKVEVKNLNSFRFVEKAINYEIKRQIKLLKKGQKPIQETRGWDETKQITYSQRIKEEAQDYRYFPEPDLPPIRWTKQQIATVKSHLPELPDQKIARFSKNFGLSDYQAQILIGDQKKTNYFEKAASLAKKHQLAVKEVANIIINKRINIDKTSPKQLIKILLQEQAKPKISETKLKQIVKQIIKKNQKAVEDYKKGKKGVIEFLLGQVMVATHGQADPNQARQLIKEGLK